VPEHYFHDLVQANLQDQRVSRYATFDDLLGYCRLSADPVGRIVLALFGEHTDDQVALSDRRAGRVYVPLEDLVAFGVAEEELDASAASPALARLMRFEIERAAGMLAEGTPLVRRLHGWARCCVAGYVAGGRATVTALRRTKGDVLRTTATPSRARTVSSLVRLLATRPGRRSA
jgi:phytoene/squalene synthetase